MPEEDQAAQQAKEYYNKGLFAFEKKNYDYAIELFSSALNIKKDFAEARHYLRLSAQRKFQENPPSASVLLLGRIKSLPLLIKAMMLDARNNASLAIEVYEKVLTQDPSSTYVLSRLAQDLIKEQDTSSALKVFEQIKQINPKNIVALKNLGKLYAQTENYPLARQCYEAVLKIAPHDAEAEKGVKNLDALGTIKESFG